MAGPTVKLAAAQMLVEGGQVARNLGRAAAMIREAARCGCQIVVLPECLDVGWTHPAARAEAEPIPGSRTQRLRQAAAEAGVVVCAGLTEREKERIYNAAVLIDGQGRLLLKYRKINELEVALDLYDVGDRLGVARTPVGCIGVDICADNFPNAPEIGSTLGRMGAQLLLSPSAWAVEAGYDQRATPYGQLWRDAYRALATRFHMAVVGASNVGPIAAGPWAGRQCIGCSLVVDADGNVVIMGPYAEESLVVAEVRLSENQPKGTRISGMM